jgi:REP element-mobilizing transposase RayT
MEPGIEFFTATCLNWQPLLREDSRKTIVLDSLKFLVEDGRIWLYGFVIMPNHVHLLWCKRDKWVDKNIQQMFLKYCLRSVLSPIRFFPPSIGFFLLIIQYHIFK